MARKPAPARAFVIVELTLLLVLTGSGCKRATVVPA